MKALLLLLAGCAAQSWALFFFCSELTVLDDLKMEEFEGLYYVYARASIMKDVAPFISGYCVRHKYKLIREDMLYLTSYTEDSKGTISATKGYLQYKYPAKKNGVLTLSFEIGILNSEMDFQIMAFNKGKFCIIYACKLGISYGVILTTQKKLSDEDLALMNTAVQEAHKNGAPNPEDYEIIDHEGCKDDEI